MADQTSAGGNRTNMTQVFVATTLYGLANLAAAVDASLFDPPSGRVRRLLVISNNVELPEVNPSVIEMAGADLLAKRFDQVVSYNEAIAPFHPTTWNPRQSDAPIWQRYLRRMWDLDEDRIHLVVESIQVEPAQAICEIFADARIDVYADGLMSYGPTRTSLDPIVGTRVERLLYADLVPGLTPMLLSEWDARPLVIPTESLKRVLAEIAGETDLSGLEDGEDSRPVAVLLGQYLTALGILTAREEENLHLQMLRGAVTRGFRRVIFKPHPLASRELADTLRTEAGRLDVDLQLIGGPALVETFYLRLPVALVVGCFSTGMITAASFYHIPVARVGTEMILERLVPYQNSNRIPATLIDACVATPSEPDTGFPRDRSLPLNDLVTTVGYVMQPLIGTGRRDVAERFLAAGYDQYARYFRRRRLTRLSLPGSLPPRSRRHAALRRAGRMGLRGIAKIRRVLAGSLR